MQDGITRAVDHAEQVTEDWSANAKQLAIEYVWLKKKGDLFQVEDIREWAYKTNRITPPPSERAWGAITKHLQKLSLIIPAGYAPVANKKANCTPARVWQVV